MKKVFLLFLTFIGILLTNTQVFAEVSAEVTVIKLQKKVLSDTVILYGRIQADPDKTQIISLPINGQINHVFVKSGELVKKDDILFTFTPDRLAQLNYQQASTSLALAKSELARVKQQFKQQLATRSQLASAEKSLADANANMQTVKALGGDSENKIKAPFDGIVSQLMVNSGDRIQAGNSVIQFADCDQLLAHLGADPSNAEKIRPSMKGAVNSLLSNGKTMTGKVIKVMHQVDPQTKLIDVWLTLPSETCRTIFPGTSVQAKITLATKALWAVPDSAVLTNAKGAYVYQVLNHRAKRITVTPLWHDHHEIGIESQKLSTGDFIVSQGNYELEDNMLVRITQ